MAENLRPAVPPPALDLAGTVGCGSAVTRAGSDESTSTVGGSKGCLIRNENARSGQSPEWTDEKHSLYLDSLEASFVNQLHTSIGLFGMRSHMKMWEPNSFHKLSVNAYNSSDEFTVLRDSCWPKINFGGHQLLLNAGIESHEILENPWVRHFRSAGECHAAKSSDRWKQNVDYSKGIRLRGKRTFFKTSLEQLPACHPWHQDSVGGITEGSDQNFIDEDQENKSSSVLMAKRLKTDAADASSTVQGVLHGRFLMTGDSSASNINPQRQKEKNKHGKNDHQKSLRIVSPKHDVSTSSDGSGVPSCN